MWKEMRHEGTEDIEVSLRVLRAFVVSFLFIDYGKDDFTRKVMRNGRKPHNPKVFS